MPEPDDKPSQLDKFKEAARKLETDDDPEQFRERLAALVKHTRVGDLDNASDPDGLP